MTKMIERLHDGHRVTIALWVAVVLIVCWCVAGVLLGVTAFITDPGASALRHTLLTEHLRAVVGLPSAAGAAFIIVTLFRQGEEPIKIKGLGFELEGAAGPVVLWVFCLLAICGGFRLLW